MCSTLAIALVQIFATFTIGGDINMLFTRRTHNEKYRWYGYNDGKVVTRGTRVANRGTVPYNSINTQFDDYDHRKSAKFNLVRIVLFELWV